MEYPGPIQRSEGWPSACPRILWWDLGRHRRVFSPACANQVQVIRDGPLHESVLKAAELVFVEAHDIREEASREALSRLAAIPGRPPILLLTAFKHENVRYLAQISLDDLAWTFEHEREVLARGLRLVQRTERSRMVSHLCRSCSNPDVLDPILKRLFQDPCPPCRVQDLAKDCFMSRRTLSRTWQAAWIDEPPVSLKTLLAWAVALRARELSRSGVNMHDTARTLRVDHRTLERTVRRLANCTWSSWRERGTQEIMLILVRAFSQDQ